MLRGEVKLEGEAALRKYFARANRVCDDIEHYAHMKGIPDKVLEPSPFTKTEIITGTDKEQQVKSEYRRSLPEKVRRFFASMRAKILGDLE